MSVLDILAGLIAPHVCLGCGKEGMLLCGECQASLPPLPSRCYRCCRHTVRDRTCRPCRHSSRLYSLHAVTDYEFIAKEIVWRLKFAGAQAAAVSMAAGMARKLLDNRGGEKADSLFIVAVPTATRRVRQRGYDQASLLAREIHRVTGMRQLNCLARTGQAHQVGAGRKRRLEQLQGAFRVTRPLQVRDAHIILVDDVVTTGATLEAAATVLRAAGARRVEAVVFAAA